MGAEAQRVVVDISMSLDGFIAGPNPTLEEPLGTGGERLHEWILGLASWRERHGESGGARNADDEVVAESLAATGAVVMGRRCSAVGKVRGKTIRTRAAGGETHLRSRLRCSSSRTTLVSRWR